MPTHAALAAALLLAVTARAQHCAPLFETWLSETRIEHVEHQLKIHVQFAKHGGAGAKDAYQGYLVAYLDRDEAKVPAATGDVIDPAVALVLHTQVMRRNGKAGAPGPSTYDLDCTIADQDLVDKILALGKLGEQDRDASGSWDFYKHHIRLAVFVPFLDDKKYSVLDGLPEQRHECNYENDRALLFQALPCRLQFLVSRSPDTNGRVWVRVRSDKPRPQR